MQSESKQWVWIDLELTGLDLTSDQIVEISVILTDTSLSRIIEGPSLVVHQSDETLEKMNDFVTKMHTKSGLIQLVKESQCSVSQAELAVLNFLSANNVNNATLAGNSVHMDRLFLLKHMPLLFRPYISPFTLMDVSSIKQIYLLYKSTTEPIAKKQNHRSLEDIRQSIEELRFYINSGFTNLLSINS